MSTTNIGDFWDGCPLVRRDPEVVSGAPVFVGTRMPVEDAVEFYYSYREQQGMSDEEAVAELLKEYRSIPDAEALRGVLAYERTHHSLMQPF